MGISYKRQVGLIDIETFRDNVVTIIGCGAMGSFIAISLAKMGLTKFVLYDFDKVEEHNLPNQFFGEKDIGKNKATVTAEYMKMFNSDVEVEIHEMYETQLLSSSIVISAVDVMEIRAQIFHNLTEKVQLFIDTRMAGLQGQLYSIDVTNEEECENYEKTLFSSQEASEGRCTARSIIFTVLGISSMVCNQIVKALNGEEIKNYIVMDYSVPQMF